MQRIVVEMLTAVLQGLRYNWFTLSFAIITVSVLRAYINPEKLKEQLLRKPRVSIAGSVAFGAFTPFCAAGTLGLVVGLLTTVLPWGPIMAFLTSSPLMGPDDFIMVAGVISLKFAVALALASIVIGLGSGYLTYLIETKTGFLKDQTRFTEKPAVQAGACGNASACNTASLNPTGSCACVDPTSVFEYGFRRRFFGLLKRIKWREIGKFAIQVGIKNMLFYFSIFVAVGFLISRFVPTSIIAGLLGARNVSAVPLAALIGLPLYVTTEASIPLIKALMAQGASDGAMLAFWITGQTTSAWVLVGLATFMKRRVIGLYILYVLAGGIVCGYLYDLFNHLPF